MFDLIVLAFVIGFATPVQSKLFLSGDNQGKSAFISSNLNQLDAKFYIISNDAKLLFRLFSA